MNYDRWPRWFAVPEQLKYQAKKQWLFDRYELFISRHSKSRRMPIALYYKALLNEYSPDIRALGEREILCFYSDYPYESSREIWYELYTKFGQSPESIEARWRIAKHWAGQSKFERADRLLAEAQNMTNEHLKLSEKQQSQTDTLFSPFRPPADSAMTEFKLTQLQAKLNQLRNLISAENRTDNQASVKRLAKFVMLNHHASDYTWHLDELLEQTDSNDRLRDNALLAKAKLIADQQLRAEKLAQLHNKFQNTDGGMQALYELGLLKISQWQQSKSNIEHTEQQKQYLARARLTLTSFVSSYPNSLYAEQVKKILDELPIVE